MTKGTQEDTLDILQILNRLKDKAHYIVITLVIALTLAYIYNRISPRVYEVRGIMRLMTGITKAEQILEAVGVKEKTVNIEDEVLALKSSDNINDALNLLDFNIGYFTKGDLISRERYRKDFPVEVKLSDSSTYQAVGVPFFITILSEEEFELTAQGNEVSLYNYLEDRFSSSSIEEFNFSKRYRFGQPIRESFIAVTVSLTGNPNMYLNDAMYFTFNTPADLIKEYYGKLELNPGGRNSNILIISTKGNVIRKEIEFVNALMDVIIQNDLDKKNQEYVNTINFIDYQLANISDSLYKAERALESYQFSATSIGESGLLYSRRDQYEGQLADLNLRMSYLRTISSNLESVDGVANISAPTSVGIDDPLFNSLLLKLSELNQQRMQMGRTATSANPIIQRIDLDIAATQSSLRDALNEIISSTNLAINDITNRLRETNATINRLPGSEIRKLGAERKFQFSDNTYDLLLQRKAAAGIAIATTVSDWTIIERGRLNSDMPVSPNTKFIFLMALFIGIGLPSALILGFDALNNKIRSKDDIEKLTEIPLLGVVVKGKKYTKTVDKIDGRSLLIESLYNIRANIQFLGHDSQTSIIGFTSSKSGEGKTFCMVNLGIVLAKSEKNVLLIDADLRKSTMLNYFESDNKMGLSSYLAGIATLSQIIHRRGPNLDVILSGPIPPNPFDLLSNKRFEDIFDQLKDHYNYILIDAPPIGLVSDYLLIQKHVNSSIFVTRQNYTNRRMVEEVDQLHIAGKLRNISLILNDVKPGRMYEGYYAHDRQPQDDLVSNTTKRKTASV